MGHTRFAVFPFLVLLASLGGVSIRRLEPVTHPLPIIRRIRTVVVDDSEEITQGILSFLQQQPNFEVIATVTDGRQALRRILALAPDLVLMDVQLPELGGLEVTRQTKARSGAPAIILMTCDDTPGCRAAGQAAGADAFVAKTARMPIHLAEVLETLFPGVVR